MFMDRWLKAAKLLLWILAIRRIFDQKIPQGIYGRGEPS